MKSLMVVIAMLMGSQAFAGHLESQSVKANSLTEAFELLVKNSPTLQQKIKDAQEKYEKCDGDLTGMREDNVIYADDSYLGNNKREGQYLVPFLGKCGGRYATHEIAFTAVISLHYEVGPDESGEYALQGFATITISK